MIHFAIWRRGNNFVQVLKLILALIEFITVFLYLHTKNNLKKKVIKKAKLEIWFNYVSNCNSGMCLIHFDGEFVLNHLNLDIKLTIRTSFWKTCFNNDDNYSEVLTNGLELIADVSIIIGLIVLTQNIFERIAKDRQWSNHWRLWWLEINKFAFN